MNSFNDLLKKTFTFSDDNSFSFLGFKLSDNYYNGYEVPFFAYDWAKEVIQTISDNGEYEETTNNTFSFYSNGDIITIESVPFRKDDNSIIYLYPFEGFMFEIKRNYALKKIDEYKANDLIENDFEQSHAIFSLESLYNFTDQLNSYNNSPYSSYTIGGYHETEHAYYVYYKMNNYNT